MVDGPSGHPVLVKDVGALPVGTRVHFLGYLQKLVRPHLWRVSDRGWECLVDLRRTEAEVHEETSSWSKRVAQPAVRYEARTFFPTWCSRDEHNTHNDKRRA